MPKADDYVDVSVRRYTVADVKEAARLYLLNSPLTDKLTPELVLSSFVVWLDRQEFTTSNLLHFEAREEG